MNVFLGATSKGIHSIFTVILASSIAWGAENVSERTDSLKELFPEEISSDENVPKEADASDAPNSSELEALRKEIADVQAKLDKKQNVPDTTKKFSAKIGGLVVLDSLSVNQNDEGRDFYGNVDNGLFLREARFIMKGEGYERLDYECGIAVQATGGLFFKNITLGVKEVPFFQNVKVGHFKVETGMNELDAIIGTSALTYGGNTMAFCPHRRVGVASTTYSQDRRIRWFNGVFDGRALDDEASVMDDSPGLVLNTRLTGTPVYVENEEGELQEVVHLGGSFYWYDPSDSQGTTVRLRIRPTGWAVDMPYLLSGTWSVDQGSYNVSQAEAVWQKGRLGVQSETFVGSFDRMGTAWGSSLTARCFLEKGNYRSYSKDKGGFASARLENIFGKNDDNSTGGNPFLPDHWGGWELVASYSYTDMEDLKNVPNSVYGNLNETLVGLNWWWTPQLRWTFSWVRDQTDAVRAATGEKADAVSDTIGLQTNFQF